MKRVVVKLGQRSYTIYVGKGLLGQRSLIQPHVSTTRLLVVTNPIVGPLYLTQTLRSLEGFESEVLILPDGEENKTLEVINRIFDTLLRGCFSRDSTLVALGGGVIGDMAGFAAACYQRGVPYIQIPTTLLAQVDSSVGGKTGVNHSLGKNMIGAFHQPSCVVADTDTLNTLGEREFRSGIAEIIKYGLIRDVEFFCWLEKSLNALLERDPQALSYAIVRSCENKAAVVGADEREAGVRALLNLGHTFGHAIETAFGYGRWLHGEAVAAGICLAADLSTLLGWLGHSDVLRIKALIARAGLPVRMPDELDDSQMLELMSVDKKVRGGRMRFVLLRGIGDAMITDQITTEALKNVLRSNRSDKFNG